MPFDARFETTAAGKTSGVTAPRKIAFIGNSLPRRCGIATFTGDLQRAIAEAGIETATIAMTDRGQEYDYPPEVAVEVRDDIPGDYEKAAAFLNEGGFQAVSLQHEFGIFGGAAGADLLPLLERLTIPLVTTFHTVLAEPSADQARVFSRIVELSAAVVVMAQKGAELLRTVYGVADSKIHVVPHGIPDLPFYEPEAAKQKFGFTGRSVILTFGLLSPNKGVEVMIDAMPAVLERCPDAVYVVLGATHPKLVRDTGEVYREALMARVAALGIEDKVVFLDHFVDQPTLLEYISMCDVYVTPYRNATQMTSGTLAYSFGSGKAVVSTPYWHAAELLADDKGVLVPFADPQATGAAVAELLTNDALRLSMRRRAYASSRSMTWEGAAGRYTTIFANAATAAKKVLELKSHRASEARQVPDMRFGHLLAMCDDTGLMQHAVHCVPDRAHGYCVDDNARALLLACALARQGAPLLPEGLTQRLAAFVQHAYNSDIRRFRNFMSFERRWLEPSGSEDSHGRTLWALGECARNGPTVTLREWAGALFIQALPSVVQFTSPRASAFALLGLDAYCKTAGAHESAAKIRGQLADRLMARFEAARKDGWTWFESSLSYDNARLPQALIVSGMAMAKPSYLEAGLATLAWLTSVQTTPDGIFRPVGTASFGRQGLPREAFDQQPVEACASIAACLAAWRAEGGGRWPREAERAFAWFMGANDLKTPLVDVDTGSCRDGLHPDRANENRGAESVLSYLLGQADIRLLPRLSQPLFSHRFPLPAASASGPLPRQASQNRGRLVANNIPEPSGSLPAARSGESGRAPVQTGSGAPRPQPH